MKRKEELRLAIVVDVPMQAIEPQASVQFPETRPSLDSNASKLTRFLVEHPGRSGRRFRGDIASLKQIEIHGHVLGRGAYANYRQKHKCQRPHEAGAGKPLNSHLGESDCKTGGRAAVGDRHAVTTRAGDDDGSIAIGIGNRHRAAGRPTQRAVIDPVAINDLEIIRGSGAIGVDGGAGNGCLCTAGRYRDPDTLELPTLYEHEVAPALYEHEALEVIRPDAEYVPE